MRFIRRAFALAAATAIAALVPISVGACGSAQPPTNGLEQRSPADVLQQAAAALKAAPSVHVVGSGPDTQLDAHIKQGAVSGSLTVGGHKVKVTIIGSTGYISADQAGMQMMGVPQKFQRLAAGRWLKMPASSFTGFTLADLASQLTAYHGPLAEKVSQATLDGKPVVVVTWRDGSKLYVANTGPAYPLRGKVKGDRINFTEYGAHFQVTAPANVIDVSGGG